MKYTIFNAKFIILNETIPSHLSIECTSERWSTI